MNNQEVLCLLDKKIKRIINQCPKELPEVSACTDGQYFSEENLKSKKDFFHIMNWTTSFITGMALLSYENNGDKELLKFVMDKNDLYHQKVFKKAEDTMHDLGFLYSLQNVALYRLTGDPYSKKIALRAAEVLSQRFMPEYGMIRAWGRMDDSIPAYVTQYEAKDHFFTQSQGLAIIDCMMNLPLLYFAVVETGNPFFADIANAHANNTIKYFIRADGSLYHSYRLIHHASCKTGGCNYCGYGDESYWARGASWAIYGFALAYSYTKNLNYLNTARKLAVDFISKITMDFPVPVWDFYLPEEEERTLDTSAAAIAANGFLLLYQQTKEREFLDYANTIADFLSENYMNPNEDTDGILREQNGRHTYTLFGDYFFFELMMNLEYMDRQLYW